MDKTKNRGMGNVANELQAAPNEGFANPIEILRERLKKWTNNNKEKKSLMDMYIRNVNIIEDAFSQIKQQTGISSTEEIVTTFIKAEEQNYSLYNYVNSLNSEIDMIDESNRNIEGDIKTNEQMANMTMGEKEALKMQLTNVLEQSEKQMIEKDIQIKTIEGQMLEIKNNVQFMVEAFRKSHFFLSVAQPMQYDKETQFNESNVTLFLAELEEYISLFITYLAYKQEAPDAAIASLSLNDLKQKDFDKEKNPFSNVDNKGSNDIQYNDDLETEDEITTDPSKLFKIFEEMYRREHQD